MPPQNVWFDERAEGWTLSDVWFTERRQSNSCHVYKAQSEPQIGYQTEHRWTLPLKAKLKKLSNPINQWIQFTSSLPQFGNLCSCMYLWEWWVRSLNGDRTTQRTFCSVMCYFLYLIANQAYMDLRMYACVSVSLAKRTSSNQDSVFLLWDITCAVLPFFSNKLRSLCLSFSFSSSPYSFFPHFISLLYVIIPNSEHNLFSYVLPVFY